MSTKIRIVMLYILGIICITYPLCSRFIAYINQTSVVNEYTETVDTMSDEELDKLNKKAEDFNENASTETAIIDSSVGNSESDENTISSYSFLELGETIGYITIPKINITLPIYEGITTNNLTKGVGHMSNTSLPNGDVNTHSVLCGHTGIAGTEIFDNINTLEEGDTFIIDFYGNETTYKVISYTVVSPDDTSGLRIEEGKTLVTLVTCTPKSLNTHRLLITGEKVEKTQEDIATSQDVDISNTSITKDNLFISFIKRNIKLVLVIVIFILVIILLNIIMGIIRKKKQVER